MPYLPTGGVATYIYSRLLGSNKANNASLTAVLERTLTAVLERTLTAVLQSKMPTVQDAKDYKMLTATKDHKDQQQGLIHPKKLNKSMNESSRSSHTQ
jgi:hypothetical protein